jgi:hypothetical protein
MDIKKQNKPQYLGFKVMYRNKISKWLRWFLPKEVIVVQVSSTGKGQRLKVPVNQGIRTQFQTILFQDVYHNIFFVVARIWGQS